MLSQRFIAAAMLAVLGLAASAWVFSTLPVDPVGFVRATGGSSTCTFGGSPTIETPINVSERWTPPPPVSNESVSKTGWEPTIDVANRTVGGASTRHIFLTATRHLGVNASLLRSTDGGTSFTPLNFNRTEGTEGDLDISPDGRVYFIEVWGSGRRNMSWTDYGETFSYDQEYTHVDPEYLIDDRPWVVAGSDGLAYYFLNHLRAQTNGNAEIFKTTDGVAWSKMGDILSGNFAHGAIDEARERLWVVYENRTSSPWRIEWHVYNTSSDALIRNGTIAEPLQGTTFPQFFAIAVDIEGTPYVTWPDGHNAQESMPLKVRWAWYNWSSEAWTVSTLSPSQGTYFHPWIAAGGDGRTVIAWYGNESYTGIPPLATNPTNPLLPIEWHVYAAVIQNASTANPEVTCTRLTSIPIAVGPISDVHDAIGDFLWVDIDSENRFWVAYSMTSNALGPGYLHAHPHIARQGTGPFLGGGGSLQLLQSIPSMPSVQDGGTENQRQRLLTGGALLASGL